MIWIFSMQMQEREGEVDVCTSVGWWLVWLLVLDIVIRKMPFLK
jgi:hypothetical protein